ncbi:MAG: hypothetical protein WDN48_06875 [Pseudolabrys sp.]
MVWPSWRDSGSSTMRPMMSMVLPALKGTTARMVLAVGQAPSARAKLGSAGAAKAPAANVKKRRR